MVFPCVIKVRPEINWYRHSVCTSLSNRALPGYRTHCVVFSWLASWSCCTKPPCIFSVGFPVSWSDWDKTFCNMLKKKMFWVSNLILDKWVFEELFCENQFLDKCVLTSEVLLVRSLGPRVEPGGTLHQPHPSLAKVGRPHLPMGVAKINFFWT